MTIRRAIVATVFLCIIPGLVQAQPARFELSLFRKYGRAALQQCRLDISISERSGSASLQCASKNGKSPLVVPKELSADEVQSLTELLARADLFDGVPGKGTDLTPLDGIFETLEVHKGVMAVVAVTSGNPTFVEDPARKQLLDLLKAIEKRISS